MNGTLVLMDFISNMLDDKQLYVAVCALIVIVVVQLGFIGLSLVTKRIYPPMPLFEIVTRPFLIKMIDRLNRSDRSDFALIIRGAMVLFIIMVVILVFDVTLKAVMPYVPSQFWSFMSIVPLLLFLSPLGAIRSILSASGDIAQDNAYRNIAVGLNENLITTDKHGMRRAGIKLLSVSMVDWMIAPILFYMIGGYVGLYFYGVLSLFVRITGQGNGSFISMFGMIYKIMNFIINIFGVFLVFISSLFSAGGKPLQVFHAFKKRQYMTLSAMAYAQNVTLGGVYQNRHGDAVKSPWVGGEGATAKLENKDVIRVVIQYGIAVFLLFVGLITVYIYT